MPRLDHYLRRKRDAQITAAIREQQGVISKAQALEAGASEQRVFYLLQSKQWKTLHQNVYCHATHPSTFEQRAIAGCLAAGKSGLAVASGLTAARVHQLDGAVLKRDRLADGEVIDEEPITIAATKRARVRGIKVFVDRRLGEEDVTVVRGIPVLSVARTILDLARRYPRWRAERALDYALRRGLTSLPEVEAVLDRVRRQRKRCLGRLARILAGRVPEDARVESRLEQRVIRGIRQAGLPTPVPQHPVPVGERTVHLDLAYPDARLGIEVDGFEFHRGRRAFDVDRRRANALMLAGWTIIRVTSDMSGKEIAAVVAPSLRGASRAARAS